MALMNPEGDYGKQRSLPQTPLQYLNGDHDVMTDIVAMQAVERNRGYETDMGVLFARKVALVGREYLQAVLTHYPFDTRPGSSAMSPEHRISSKGALAAAVFGASYEALYDFLHEVPSAPDGSRTFDNAKLFALFDTTLPSIGITSDDILERVSVAKRPHHYNQQTVADLQLTEKTYGLAALLEKWNTTRLPTSVHHFAYQLFIEGEVQEMARLFGGRFKSIQKAERLLQSVFPMDARMETDITSSQNETARRLLDW